MVCACVVHSLTAPIGLPLYKAVQKHEAEHKLLESILMLAYPDQFAEGAEAVSNLATSGTTPLRGKNCMLSGLLHHVAHELDNEALWGHYLPIQLSKLAYNQTATGISSSGWTAMPSLSGLLLWTQKALNLAKTQRAVRPPQTHEQTATQPQCPIVSADQLHALETQLQESNSKINILSEQLAAVLELLHAKVQKPT